MAVKLVCDRCGKEVTDKDALNAIYTGTNAWRDAVRARGEEPRGVFPCENYVRCRGEMIVVKK
jgi:hypothetical protein